MASATRVPVSDRVFQRLVSDILSGRYRPGDKLPTQRALASDLGLNMAPVREAIKRVEQLKLIEVRHGDAMRVLDWRRNGGLDVAAHLVFRAGNLDEQTFESMIEARRMFLAAAASLAAERRTDEQADRLEAIAARIAGASGTAEAQRLDFEFYSELVAASGNVVFTLVMNSISTLFEDLPALFEPVVHDLDELAPLYVEVAESIGRGEAGRAVAAVERLSGAQAERLRGAVPSGGEAA